MKFSANPTEQVRLSFNLLSKAPFKMAITLQAPYLSIYMVSMNPVGLMFKPPASKVNPFPTREMYSSESGFPL